LQRLHYFSKVQPGKENGGSTFLQEKSWKICGVQHSVLLATYANNQIGLICLQVLASLLKNRSSCFPILFKWYKIRFIKYKHACLLFYYNITYYFIISYYSKFYEFVYFLNNCKKSDGNSAWLSAILVIIFVCARRSQLSPQAPTFGPPLRAWQGAQCCLSVDFRCRWRLPCHRGPHPRLRQSIP